MVEAALIAAGLPEAALARPGLPAMHTVQLGLGLGVGVGVG